MYSEVERSPNWDSWEEIQNYIRRFNPFECTVSWNCYDHRFMSEGGCRSFFSPENQDVNVRQLKTVVGLTKPFTREKSN